MQNAAELQRLGVRVEVRPGQVLPLNGAWRLRAGEAGPVRVEIAGATLSIPSHRPSRAP